MRVCEVVVVVEVGGCLGGRRGGGRKGCGGGLPLLLWRWVAFPLVRVVGGALARNTLFGEQIMCIYDISKKVWFFLQTQL